MKTCLVLGGANTLWDDAIRALLLFTPDTVIAVNNTIIDWPGRLDFAATLHPLPTKRWPGLAAGLKQRQAKGFESPAQTWAHKSAPGVTRQTTDWAGSSGLFAVKIALETGHDRIVAAGVPMTKAAEHYHTPGEWQTAESFRGGWRKHLKEIKPFVRSMSGWTKELLGSPTEEFLSRP